jgi:MSHA biogenesis protein MshO
VVYNLGIPGADAYSGTAESRRAFGGVAGSLGNITFAGGPYLLPSPGNRFHVVEGPVTYVCDLGAGTLTRYWGYAIVAAQAAPPAGGSSAMLADRVTACDFSYTAGAASRAGLVTLRLTLARDGESVTLYHAVHVSNVP